jgi:hypothetical protein
MFALYNATFLFRKIVKSLDLELNNDDSEESSYHSSNGNRYGYDLTSKHVSVLILFW